MALRSEVSKKYLLRFGIVGTIMVAFGFYCLYDGLVVYPEQLLQYQEYKKLEEEVNTEIWPIVLVEHGWAPFDKEEHARVYQEMKDAGRQEDWLQLVSENNWITYEPKARTQNDILMQFVMMGACWLIALPITINVLRLIGSWIELDGSVLRNRRGQEVPLEQITKIDKKKWEKKGIAKIHYEKDGTEKKFTLDDFIYERKTADEILLKIEQEVGVGKIINGKPEKVPAASEPEPAKPVEQPTAAT